MNQIASFFFLGTAQHRKSNRNAITSFYKATRASKTTARLFDGVGCNPDGAPALVDFFLNNNAAKHPAKPPFHKKHPTPGNYVYNPKNDEKKELGDPGISQNIRSLMKRINGCIAGEGIDELMFEAISYLGHLKSQGKLPTVLNLHGFSRGADTCLRLANMLDSLYPEIKLNLFLIDQVPGPGRLNDLPSYKVPANVQRFESITMLHEYKPGFNVQDSSRYVFASPSTTKVTFKVYPGVHGQGMNLTPNQHTNHVAQLVHDDFFRFCTETGSLPQASPPPVAYKEVEFHDYYSINVKPLNPMERFQLYSDMQKNWSHYEAGIRFNSRPILSKYQWRDHHKKLFVNQEHAELFAQIYPETYNWFYKNSGINLNEKGRADAKEQVSEQLADLATKAPEFYKQFCQVHNIAPNRQLPESRSLPAYHYHRSGTPLVTDELSYLRHAITSIINFEEQHRKRSSKEHRSAIVKLKTALNNSELEAPEIARVQLRNKINEIRNYLFLHDHKNYLYYQLARLSINANHLKLAFDQLIDNYCQNNPILPEKQKLKLREMSNSLDQIVKNPSSNYLQQSQQAKKIISQAALYLKMSQKDLDSVDDNFQKQTFSKATHFFHPKNCPPPVNTLIKKLNELSSPSFEETSLASDIAKLFNAYYNRGQFWRIIGEILSYILPLKVSTFASPKKLEIALVITKELEHLESEGKGNNVTEVSRILLAGQNQLHKHYQSCYIEADKIPKGELDQIFMKSQRGIMGEAPEFDINNIEETDELNSFGVKL